MATPPLPTLILAWGNPSRGDDALGPAVYDALTLTRARGNVFGDIDLLTDFQLQIEHAIDLQARERVLFVDAGLAATPPFEFHELTPARDISYTTHAMSPGSVLSVYEQINRRAPPPAFMLTIRGYAFNLGEPLSARARRNLQHSLEFIETLIAQRSVDNWKQQASQISQERA